MLDRLYKKLHIIFVSGVMLIITLIIGIICINYVHTQQNNDSTFFQRISTLLIYQLEDTDQNFKAIINEYENKYPIRGILKDDDNSVIYQSKSSYPTDTETLLEQMEKQLANITTDLSAEEQSSTTQSGIYDIAGTHRDKYWGIFTRIITDAGNAYDLILIWQQKTALQILQPQLPLFLFIWAASFVGVILISRLILKKALEPTERVLKRQKEFVASASHELKSPLAVILANVEAVDKLSTDNQEIQKSVQVMDSECMRMSQLIKDMLLLASSDAKTWTLHKSEININTLLITLYETYEPLCMKHKITLNLDIGDIYFPKLYSDKERISQILSIYMDNAIQHSVNNSCIQIQTALTANHITFYVIDHGQGIADEDKPHIFDRFYCADKSHTDKSHFGLGLSIADELAKMLNGKVGFKDTNGGGATFFVTLPIK